MEEEIEYSAWTSENNAFQTPVLTASRSGVGQKHSPPTVSATAGSRAAPAVVRGRGVTPKKHPAVQGAWHGVNAQTGVQGKEQ